MENDSNGVQYFLARIEELEKVYNMKSWKFQLLYENDRKALPGYSGQAAVDYSEWAFLCENLSHTDGALCESPPWVVTDADQQKPEDLSGFCFSGERDHVSAAVSGSRREYAFGQERTECCGRY
jgi:hypothetical protein